jgi:hypothetical protein
MANAGLPVGVGTVVFVGGGGAVEVVLAGGGGGLEFADPSARIL